MYAVGSDGTPVTCHQYRGSVIDQRALKYMIRFSQMSDESKEVVKSMIQTMHKADQDRGLLVEPDGELDHQLENLIFMKR